MKPLTKERRRQISITDEQFKVLWDAFPQDEELIAEVCREALYDVTPPNREGIWPKYNVRVYVDEFGFNASGYLMVHWTDAKNTEGPWLDTATAPIPTSATRTSSGTTTPTVSGLHRSGQR